MPPRFTSSFAVLFLLSSLAVPQTQAREKQQSWNQEFAVTGRPTVRIETEDARVVVHSWKESRVTARVEMTSRTGGLVLGSRQPLVELTQSGNEVRVRARIHGASAGIYVFSSIRFEVEVWLPRQSDLIVQSNDGAVSVEEVEGRIDLDTQDGALTARALKGDIAVHSSDGRVELDGVDGSLRLETRDGPSEIRGRFDHIDVRSQDGGIEADILPGSRLQEGWSLRSQDGGIHLRIPRTLPATLEVRTRDGHLSIDLPMRIQGGQVGRHDLVADINGGGGTLKLRSGDGAIEVAAID